MDRSLRLLGFVFLVAALLLSAGTVQAEESVNPDRLEYERLLEILKTAKPAPNPVNPQAIAVDSDAAEQRWTVEYNTTTGEERILFDDIPDLSEAPVSYPGFIGLPPNGIGHGIEGDNDASGEGPGITPTPPSPLFNAQGQPWNTVYKLLMRFNVSGTDYYYVCSAFSIGDFHLGTAGHCIFNWDPNDDGSTADARWAAEVWAWAAQMDAFHPVGEAERPYGLAKSTHLRSWTGWTSDQNFDHDFAAIVLNRRMGQRTGWLGRGGALAGSLNFSGYPTETPYVPAGSLVQYYGYDDNNVDSSTSYRIQLDAFIYGGHSGGPSWKYVNPDRWIQGIHSTSDRVGSAWDTLLTDAKLNSFSSWKTTDESERPPIARPDMIEHRLDTEDRKQLVDTSAAPGGAFQAEYNILNAGHAQANNVSLDFYLSLDDNITHGDHLVETLNWPTFDEWTVANHTTSFTVPPAMSPGNYYFGWIASTSTTEYESGDNTVVISDQMFTVTGSGNCDPDFVLVCGTVDNWSNDGAGSTDNIDDYACNGLNYAGPEYAYQFTAAQTGTVEFTLDGLSADLDLLALSGPSCDPATCVEDSTSSGTTAEHLSLDVISGSTYRIVVDGWNGATSSYTLTVDCGDVDEIFSDGFESGDTSAW